MKILIVDDDPTIRFLLAMLVEDLGHEMSQAADGDEAWRLFQAEAFDVVLTDWLMPGTDGEALCRRIRACRRPQYPYLIMITVLDAEGWYRRGIEAGADDFLTKPVSPDMLGARLTVAQRILGLESTVKQLEGLLSICAYCKKIRDEEGHWEALERYVGRRSAAEFSHGICPTCFAQQMRDMESEGFGPGG